MKKPTKKAGTPAKVEKMETPATYSTPGARALKKMLPVKLTRDELYQTGRDLTALMSDRDDKQIQLATYNKIEKKKLDDLSGEIWRCRRMIATESENREVDCSERPDFDAKKMTTVRVDTGEIVYERDLTEEEMFLKTAASTISTPAPMAPKPDLPPASPK